MPTHYKYFIYSTGYRAEQQQHISIECLCRTVCENVACDCKLSTNRHRLSLPHRNSRRSTHCTHDMICTKKLTYKDGKSHILSVSISLSLCVALAQCTDKFINTRDIEHNIISDSDCLTTSYIYIYIAIALYLSIHLYVHCMHDMHFAHGDESENINMPVCVCTMNGEKFVLCAAHSIYAIYIYNVEILYCLTMWWTCATAGIALFAAPGRAAPFGYCRLHLLSIVICNWLQRATATSELLSTMRRDERAT